MRRQRVLSPIEAAFLARVKAKFNAHDPGARSEFGRQVGLSPSSVTAVLAGDQVPHIEKWAPIAAYLGFTIADLFTLNSEELFTRAESPRSPSEIQSDSGRAGALDFVKGDQYGATLTRKVLRQQLAAREKEIATLREAVDMLALELETLANAVRPRLAAGPAARPRQRH